MNKTMMTAVVLAGLILMGATPARALEDKRLAWGRSDTNLHMAGAFVGTFAGTELLYHYAKLSRPASTAISTLAVLAAGVVKEFAIDKQASGSDLMANGVGAGANIALQFVVRF